MVACGSLRRWRYRDDAVRLAVIGKLGWIKRQQARFQASRGSPNGRWSAAKAITFGVVVTDLT